MSRCTRRSFTSRTPATSARSRWPCSRTTAYQESIFSFANNINTHEGGTHLSGFRSALTRTINNYARQKGLLKEKDADLEGDDVREGLTAIISVKVADPQFEGQTKTKLGNPRSRGSSRRLSTRSSPSSWRRTPRTRKRIIDKAVEAAARAVRRRARRAT